MLPLYQDSCFTFRFVDDRIIPRVHLEGVTPGTHVSVIKINPNSGQRLGLLATATVGDGGWLICMSLSLSEQARRSLRCRSRIDWP